MVMINVMIVVIGVFSEWCGGLVGGVICFFRFVRMCDCCGFFLFVGLVLDSRLGGVFEFEFFGVFI